MSAKPTVAPPVWDSALTHIVAITSGHATSGYANGEIPASGEFNDILNKSGQWLTYLKDGDLVLGDVNLTGLCVGAATNAVVANASQNDFDLSGGTFVGQSVFALTGGGSSAVITGIDSADATEGRLILVINETTQPVQWVAESPSSAAKNRIDFQGAPSGAMVIMPPKGAFVARYSDPPTGRFEVLLANFTIDFETRTRVDNYAAACAREVGGSDHTFNAAFITTGGTSTDPIVFPIHVEVGRTITEIELYVDKTSSAILNVDLFRIDMTTGGVTDVAGHSNTAANPGYITIGATGLSEVVLANCEYYVRLSPGGSFSPDDLVYGVSVTSTKVGL